jgi:hypothetical protein
MNNPVWQSASGIEDHTVMLRRLVDQAELDPCPELFHQIRTILSDVGNEAGSIMSRATDRPLTVLDYIVGGDPGVTEPAASSASRQHTGVR